MNVFKQKYFWYSFLKCLKYIFIEKFAYSKVFAHVKNPNISIHSHKVDLNQKIFFLIDSLTRSYC